MAVLFNVEFYSNCYSECRYEQCSWGWSDSKKREQLTEDSAWYLLAKSCTDGNLIGFSHFRFDMDEGIEVLYW